MFMLHMLYYIVPICKYGFLYHFHEWKSFFKFYVLDAQLLIPLFEHFNIIMSLYMPF